ncbi:TetR/AcrR family transcriptional regulator (plasmid) [Streptococcus salivarius]|uniref:TetR/AcrR family transcriptional regulator n=1 Tax=Streptococcus salivarius TaxID=1304 RepID=UPI0039792C5E
MKKSKILTPQKLISDIFIAKLKTDNFKEVTISEIVADANLSRSTFYRYFKNKHSVIEFFIEELLNDYLSTVAKKEITNFSDILIVYFEFLKENINHLELLKKHNFLSLMLEIERKKFLEILPQSNFPWHHNSDENELVLNLILIGGLWNISLYLLDTNQKIKPSQLASIIIESLSGNKKFI